VVDAAVAQLPDSHRYGTPILVRADGAGCSKQFLSHLRSLRDKHGMQVQFSVGFTMTEQVQQAILALPQIAWTPAVEADGELRDRADVAELTAILPDLSAAGWPTGMRVIVRRERPHPGAQLTFSDLHGYRFQAFATDTQVGQLAHLEARHRAHARVEDRIRTAKDTGLGRFAAVQHQRHLARAVPARLRPDRLDPNHPA
jgi:Transposase DDE domain group 1